MAAALAVVVAAVVLALLGPAWGLAALYYALVVPLLQRVVADMRRRGRPGWVYVAWLLCSPYLGLLGYYVDRRRFPVLTSSS